MLLAIKEPINSVYEIKDGDMKTIHKYLAGLSHKALVSEKRTKAKEAEIFKWSRTKSTSIYSGEKCLEDLQRIGKIKGAVPKLPSEGKDTEEKPKDGMLFFGIAGDVNEVYELKVLEIKQLIPLLKGVSYKYGDDKLKICSWLKISAKPILPGYKSCVKALKKVGIELVSAVSVDTTSPESIPKDESITKEAVDEETLSKAERKLIKSEIKVNRIDMNVQNNKRSSLLLYYLCKGNEEPHGNFRGKVLKIDSRGVLFKNLSVDFGINGKTVTGDEDHVWIIDCDEFLKKDININDYVGFNALVYAYRREDGTTDYALKAPCNIKVVPSFS